MGNDIYWQRDLKPGEVLDCVPDHLRDQPRRKFYRKDLIGNRWDGFKIDPSLISPYYDEADERRAMREQEEYQRALAADNRKRKDVMRNYA